MAIHFDFYPNPINQDTDEETAIKYHVRVVGSQTIELDHIVEHISQRSTLSKGDIQAVIGELSDELAHILCDGNRASIPGIGYFSLSLAAPKDAHPTQTRSQSVQIKHIEYRADQQLKNKILEHASFERIKEKKHSEVLSTSEIDTILDAYFAKDKYLNRQQFAELCHFTKATACRHLKRLVDEGRLENINTPHTPIYVPVKGNYNK